jgi:hypothetical protein
VRAGLIEHGASSPRFSVKGAQSVNAGEARAVAGRWLESHREQWPELRAAHFVGGITSMADDEPFPHYKDIDIHMIFDAGSPLLVQRGPFPNIVEDVAEGLAIEAGLKSIHDYATAEAILANPEIAHHLMMDSVIFDPDGLLAQLQPEVRKQYASRKWVEARVNYERQGFAGALAMRPMAAGMLGASGQANVLGYSHTFLSAALCIARLQAPKIGGQGLVRMRENLAASGRLDLYEQVLGILGVADVTPDQARQLVAEGAELFDIAVPARKSPHPFQHKFHAHLRPYFVDSCVEMIEDGNHREAAVWATPFLLSAADIIKADGPEAVKTMAAERQQAWLTALGMETTEALDSRFEQMAQYGEEVFALVGETVRDNRAVVTR